MELFRASDRPLTGSIQVYKQSVISAFIGLLVVWGIGAAIAVAIVQGKIPPFLWVAVGFIVLISLLFLGMLRATMGPQNWVLQFDGSKLAFKFRSYLNRHFSDEDRVVAVLPASDFEWMRKVTERKMVPGSKGERTPETWIFLEFRLKEAEAAAELDRLVQEELRREPPPIGRSRTKHHHVPVRVVDGSTIRVCWRSPRDHIRPNPDTALRNLGSAIPLGEEERHDAGDYRQMTPEELDVFLIDLMQSGHRMKAAKVVREVHGLGVKESRDYVDSLI